MSDEESKALAAALAQVKKNLGRGSIMKVDGSRQEENLDVISTGSLGVDLALGVGDLPRGRIVEIFDPESSGKTTLCLEAITQRRKNGGIYAFIDAEHTFDPICARKLGIKVEELCLSQPNTDEQALEVCDTLVCSGGVDMAVVGSVTALMPKTEIEDEMDDGRVGLQTRLVGQALRKLTGHIRHTNTLVIFINQIRMKINVMFGSLETTTGGNALKFYASIQPDIHRIGQIRRGDDAIDNETKVKVIKNKVTPPLHQTEFDILYGEGVSWEGELIDLDIKYDIIERSGTWYSCSDAKIGQGRDSVRVWLKGNPEIANEIDAKTRAAVGINVDTTGGKLDDTDGERPGE